MSTYRLFFPFVRSTTMSFVIIDSPYVTSSAVAELRTMTSHTASLLGQTSSWLNQQPKKNNDC